MLSVKIVQIRFYYEDHFYSKDFRHVIIRIIQGNKTFWPILLAQISTNGVFVDKKITNIYAYGIQNNHEYQIRNHSEKCNL